MRGNGRVFQRGRVWWIAYYHEGREYRQSSRSHDRKAAVRLLRQRLGELAAGGVHAPTLLKPTKPGVVKMADLFDLLEHNYRLKNCARTNSTFLERLRRRFAAYTVQSCTSLAISHYMAERQRAGRTAETINREMDVLRAAFRLGYQRDLLQKAPVIERLPALGVRNEFFTRQEIDALLPCLLEYLRDVVLFGFLTGWRKGEIVGLQWSNVDRSGAVIRLEPAQNKGRTVRVLALEGELAALIKRRWDARKAGRILALHVFHRAGHQLGANFRRPWLMACHQAGLGHRLFHSLRSAARNMSLQGIPEKVIMEIMGHKTRKMFDRYNIMTEADQRAYAQRLYGPKGGQ